LCRDGGDVIEKDLPEMPCRELVEVITDYLEDRLSPVDRARFEAHLAECEACRTYFEQFRQTIRALGQLPEELLSPEARSALLDAFRGWSHR
jgi:anti-sigma factor RsiW